MEENTVSTETIETVETPVETSAPEQQGVGETESAVTEQTAGEPERRVQTAEENHRYAAIRREAEASERRRYEAQLQAEKDAFYRKEYEGAVNPYTNKPILTEADYRAYRESYDREAREQALNKAGLTESEFQGLIEGSPTVREARAVIDEAKAQKIALEQQRVNSFATDEIGKLAKEYNLQLNGVEDLAKIENSKEVVELWAKGVPLTKAYAVANFDKISAQRTAAAKQDTLNRISGKEHMFSSSGAAGSDVYVPPETMEMYHALMPNAKDAEIKAHYKKHHVE